MGRNLETWHFIRKNLELKIPTVLLYVIESLGSSPGREGFCMAVNQNGELEGSIGGGIMEHKFVERAKEMLRKADAEISIHRQIHDKSAPKQQSGMICSGEQTILIYPLQNTDLEAVKKLVTSFEKGETGTLTLKTEGIEFESNQTFQKPESIVFSENDWFYAASVGFRPRLHIVGAGHCSLAFSKIMAMMDFQIHLYDDRPNLNTMAENQFVFEKVVVSDFTNLSELIPENPTDFVVIMSFGYRTDDLAIRALKDKKFAFLGVLGSKKKIEKMMNDYKSEGFDENWLSSIFAPVGMYIKSQTPEEIAISIAAQIIAVKNHAF